MMDNTYIEQENLGNHHYRTEIPNIIYKMKLSVYEHAVYSYIKQAAGDRGSCWKSVTTIADEIGISTNKLREVKISLSKPREELGGKPLIRVFKRKNETNNSALSDVIQITDIWEINMRHHLDSIENKNTSFTGRRGVLHGMKGGTSPREPKEEHTKKNNNVVVTRAHTHTRVGCGNVHEEAGEASDKIPTTFEKKTLQGKTVVCSQEDLYRYLVANKIACPTEIVVEAWRRLYHHDGPLTSWEKFTVGIINILKTKKDEKCQKQLKKNESESIKSDSLGNDMKEQVFHNVQTIPTTSVKSSNNSWTKLAKMNQFFCSYQGPQGQEKPIS